MFLGFMGLLHFILPVALTVGFDPVTYTAGESAGFVEFRIVIRPGVISGPLVVEFYTEDGSANGE